MAEYDYRDKTVALRLTIEEFELLRQLSKRYNMPPSTVAYLIIKNELNDFVAQPYQLKSLL